ncbi:MAG TPA: efflux RND transporter periplasmic adaptor subunit [Candidatus Margulisiibacteriota bacterium]|nr:efflux RND transporter periplasmic adaptor subunit [Candidatus Margulisiibacteriota bacterium]
MPVRTEAVAALLASLALLIAACSSDSAAPGRDHKDAVPVTVATAVQRDIPVQLRAIGNVEPYSTVAVKSQVEGQLAQVHFAEGQGVKRGDLLFTIDPRPFEAALRQAEATVARDTAEARNAAVDAKRRTQLLAQGFVSRDEYDQSQTKAASSAAAVKADEAAVENARLQLQYCYIHSPIDGRVGQLLVHAGNVVEANDTLLAVINQVHPIYVSFSVPEQQLPQIRQRAGAGKLAVQAFVPQHGGSPVVGELSFINNTVDTTTGTVLLKALFQNDDETLWPGQFVDVAVTLAVQHDAVLVPAEAIQVGQQGQYVFVVAADDSAEVRAVVPGDRIAAEIVVTQGLTAGERVVTDGQIRLAPGLKVQIKDGTGSQHPTPAAGK